MDEHDSKITEDKCNRLPHQPNSSPRGINHIYLLAREKIRDAIFLYEQQFGEPSLEKILVIELKLQEELDKINLSYEHTKRIFKNIIRDTGERYFEHQKGALKFYLENFVSNDSGHSTHFFIINETNTCCLILEHDTLEDTDVTFEQLLHITNPEITLGVALISKSPFSEFMDKNSIGYQPLLHLHKKGYLNDKLLLSDTIKQKLSLSKKIHPRNRQEKNILENKKIKNPEHKIKTARFGSEDYELTAEEKKAIEDFKTIKSKYKQLANDEYKLRLSSIENMRAYAQKLSQEKGLKFEDKELQAVVINAIYAKICDRYNNLESIALDWKDEPDRVIKKIQETENSLLPLISGIDSRAYTLLKTKLEEQKQSVLTAHSKQKVNHTLGTPS